MAQDEEELLQVQSDSLVRYLKNGLGEKVYFLRDPEDVAFYNISAPRGKFVEKALSELVSQGYKVTRYDGAWFVASGKGLEAGELPAGYFDVSGPAGEDEYARLLQQETVMASFRNKIYDVGDRNNPKSGLSYVRGYVRDVASGEPVPGVSVYEDKTGVYTVTDAYGFYRIGLRPGENRLMFSGYSLEDLALDLRVFGDGGLDVVMKEKVTSLRGAVVSAESMTAHRSSTVGLEQVRIATIRKIPTAFGEADVLKVVLTLPGVKSAGEAATGFNVRGGATDQNLILFNEGTIYNPSHMFGILSAFNPDVINDVELYKSSIPVEYGGRISSVMDVRSRDGNFNKLTGTLGLGLLTSNFSLEGPIAKGKTSFLIGGRTTYSDWMLKAFPLQSNYSGGSASFSDVNAGLTHKFNDRNSLRAYVYWSRDRFGFSGDTTFRYSNFDASIKWISHFSDSRSLTVSAGYDSFRNVVEDAHYDFASYSLNTGIEQAFLKLGMKSDRGSHKLSYGLQGVMYNVNPGDMMPFADVSTVVRTTLPLQKAVEAAAYAGDSWTPARKFSLDYGLRLNAFMALAPSKLYVLPDVRLSGRYSFKDNLSMKAGFNTMSQSIHMISNNTSVSPMDTWRLSNARLRPQTGWQAAGGLYWTVADHTVELSAEGYWKRMNHYLDYKSGAVLSMNPDLEDFLVETTGKAYGIELMAKKTSGKLNGWISYTYSRTLLRESEDRGVETINGGDWYRASHDKPHDVKMVANYKFTHRYSLSVNLDYSTGRPITLPVSKYPLGDTWYLAYSERNSYRIPDYFRMDIAFNMDPGHYLKAFTHMMTTIGVYNVTGRKNAYSVYYTTDNTGHVKGKMLSVFACPIPYINLNIKF